LSPRSLRTLEPLVALSLVLIEHHQALRDGLGPDSGAPGEASTRGLDGSGP